MARRAEAVASRARGMIDAPIVMERFSWDEGDLCLFDSSLKKRRAVYAFRQRKPGEEATLGSGPGDIAWHVNRQRSKHRIALHAVVQTCRCDH